MHFFILTSCKGTLLYKCFIFSPQNSYFVFCVLRWICLMTKLKSVVCGPWHYFFTQPNKWDGEPLNWNHLSNQLLLVVTCYSNKLLVLMTVIACSSLFTISPCFFPSCLFFRSLLAIICDLSVNINTYL